MTTCRRLWLHCLVGVVAFGPGLACGRRSETHPSPSPTASARPLRLQLNWFHDPTFAGEYRAAQELRGQLNLLEGGTNISPIQNVKSGLADLAVVGIDIALQAIETDVAKQRSTELRILFAEFQRNPVGWVLHPQVAEKLRAPNLAALSGRQRNDWLFARFRDGSIRPGDKRGTETTAVWERWRQTRQLSGVKVVPVGFDPAVLLSAPSLAYPVYMNEEPFKLAERIGRPVLIFDPADDGVVLYGNVIVSSASRLRSRGADIDRVLHALRSAWSWVRQNPEATVPVVKPFYGEVSDKVLLAQIRRTCEFVFFSTDDIGAIDSSQGGRLEQTMRALQAAGTVGDKLDMASLQAVLVREQALQSAVE
jgi:hypothetical protein